MPKRGKISANRRRPAGASPVGTRRVQQRGAESTTRFSALSEAQWEAIHATRNDWPNKGIDWRREIDRIGRDYWEAVDVRESWIKKLQGKQPAKQQKKIDQALVSIRQLEKALAVLADDGLPDMISPIQTFHIRSIASKSGSLNMIRGFSRLRARAT